ncbi:phosphatidylserine decarboxylase [Bacillus spongiae]|uniref:phosphatidylserine decarboxylase n=1 Tax=Bacillus spongiae TaxID=2683610 RepID=A0ABU8H8Z8_9BACI
MKKYVYQTLIELTNKRWSSMILQRFVQSSISKKLIPAYIKLYKISQSDIKKNLTQFTSLHDFFIRELKIDARSVHTEEEMVVSPVDGVIEHSGNITQSLKMIVKNKEYSVEEMLGSPEKARQYENGTFIVIYLSPAHYHRIHSPLSADVVANHTLGKHSYPVNEAGLKYGRAVLSKNFRKIIELRKGSKNVAMAMIGAMWVNSIEVTNDRSKWRKGEEVAYFSFGSTVVLLFEKGQFIPMLPKGDRAIQMGQAIGKLSK